MEYVLHIAVVVSTYGVLAISQYLILNRGGVLFATQGAFFGIGAYSTALSVTAGVPAPLALIIAAAITAVTSVPMALPAFRLRGDYLLVASLGFCEVVRALLNNLEITGGAAGFMGIPTLAVGEFRMSSPFAFAIATSAILVAYVGVVKRIETSPFGRLLLAMGDDVDALLGMGKNLLRARVSLFVFTGLWTGLAGGVWAFYLRYLDPSGFTLWESVLVMATVLAGGPRGVIGVLTASVLMTLVPEGLRFLGLPQATGAAVRQVAFGLILVTAVRWHASSR